MWLHKAQSCEKEAAVCSCAGSSVQLQNCKEKHKQKRHQKRMNGKGKEKKRQSKQKQDKIDISENVQKGKQITLPTEKKNEKERKETK